MAGMAEAYTNARVRVNRDGMEELLEALYDHEEKLLDGRDTVKNAGRAAVTRFNDRLKATRRVLGEAERTKVEQNWHKEPRDGEQIRPDTA